MKLLSVTNPERGVAVSEPFLAEIRIVGFNFAPSGHAFCDGQLLPINQNQALFALLGTTYGGDGRTTFALPDLRGRTPIHPDGSPRLGGRGGQEQHVLNQAEMPAHTHPLQASATEGNSAFPDGKAMASQFPEASPLYTDPQAPMTPMAGGHVSTTGGSQGHNNMQPFLTINFVIAISGQFPSRN